MGCSAQNMMAAVLLCCAVTACGADSSTTTREASTLAKQGQVIFSLASAQDWYLSTETKAVIDTFLNKGEVLAIGVIGGTHFGADSSIVQKVRLAHSKGCEVVNEGDDASTDYTKVTKDQALQHIKDAEVAEYKPYETFIGFQNTWNLPTIEALRELKYGVISAGANHAQFPLPVNLTTDPMQLSQVTESSEYSGGKWVNNLSNVIPACEAAVASYSVCVIQVHSQELTSAVTTTQLGKLIDDVKGKGWNLTTFRAFAQGYTPEKDTPVPETAAPTAVPTPVPTAVPTPVPTSTPTSSPTPIPTATPTDVPTSSPTSVPTPAPMTAEPTPMPPMVIPTAEPTSAPTGTPTAAPTATPTDIPTSIPTGAPTAIPTSLPTSIPTALPSSVPTGVPMTDAPMTDAPLTDVPMTDAPSTAVPSTDVTMETAAPKTDAPEATPAPPTTPAPSNDNSTDAEQGSDSGSTAGVDAAVVAGAVVGSAAVVAAAAGAVYAYHTGSSCCCLGKGIDPLCALGIVGGAERFIDGKEMQAMMGGDTLDESNRNVNGIALSPTGASAGAYVSPTMNEVNPLMLSALPKDVFRGAPGARSSFASTTRHSSMVSADTSASNYSASTANYSINMANLGAVLPTMEMGAANAGEGVIGLADAMGVLAQVGTSKGMADSHSGTESSAATPIKSAVVRTVMNDKGSMVTSVHV